MGAHALSPVLFNTFLESIMQETSTPPYLLVEGQFVIFVLPTILISLEAAKINFKTSITTRLKEKARAYGVEVSSEKSIIFVKTTNKNAPANIMMNGQNLEEVDSFKYLGFTDRETYVCSNI